MAVFRSDAANQLLQIATTFRLLGNPALGFLHADASFALNTEFQVISRFQLCCSRDGLGNSHRQAVAPLRKLRFHDSFSYLSSIQDSINAISGVAKHNSWARAEGDCARGGLRP